MMATGLLFSGMGRSVASVQPMAVLVSILEDCSGNSPNTERRCQAMRERMNLLATAG